MKGFIKLTEHEQGELERVQQRLGTVKLWLIEHAPPNQSDSVEDWFRYADAFREVLGNLNNYTSLLACFLAKNYLSDVLPMSDFDVSLKPQGAAGLDIDARTISGQRVVAEIKTTRPYGEAKFGAAQRDSILKDLTKLKRAPAEHRFMFFTDRRAHTIAIESLVVQLEGISPVLLYDSVP